MFIRPEVKFLLFAMVHPWILAPLISANDQAHNCKGLTVTVCFVVMYRASAQAWVCMKRLKGKKRCLHSSMPYLCRDLSGHHLCIHTLDLSTGPWGRWAHLSSHCLPQMNGALSPGDVEGAVMQQTSSKLLVTSGVSAAKQALYAVSSLQSMPDLSP